MSKEEVARVYDKFSLAAERWLRANPVDLKFTFPEHTLLIGPLKDLPPSCIGDNHTRAFFDAMLVAAPDASLFMLQVFLVTRE